MHASPCTLREDVKNAPEPTEKVVAKKFGIAFMDPK